MEYIKKLYSIIHPEDFSKHGRDLLQCYINEFIDIENSDKEKVKQFVRLMLHIIYDFLTKKISSLTLDQLIHASLFNKEIKKFHEAPYLWQINDLLALVHELLDIQWTEESEHYQEYLQKIKLRFDQLVEKYSQF
jgi:hypothetical protein